MNLKTYLKTSGISRKQFKDSTGISVNVINNLCSKGYYPGIKTALKIVQATNGKVTLNELLRVKIPDNILNQNS
jgi:transcriptional regulator with XRE-family HTH domain